jgi:MSHA pilin protein MshD
MRIAECGLRKAENRGASKQGGFSLIEVIITLVILSVAAVGVLSVFSTGIGGSADPVILDQAVQLAQGEADQVVGQKKASGFAAVTVGNGLACVSSMLAGFTCSRDVFYVDPASGLNTQVGGPTDYKHVTVTVTNTAIGDVTLDGLVTNY